VYEKVLKRFREMVRTREYVMTLHAEEEMTEDGFTVYDVERGVLTGEILERQRDRASGESKYRIRGTSASAAEIELIAKFGPTGTMVIITVYAP
jgi:hypothetical protein